MNFHLSKVLEDVTDIVLNVKNLAKFHHQVLKNNIGYKRTERGQG